MKLMTKELEDKFKVFPLMSQDGKGMGAEVVAEYYNPSGAGRWLITEGERQEDGDWRMFGYCHIFEWEWGYVMLSELEGIKTPTGGIEVVPQKGESCTVRSRVC